MWESLPENRAVAAPSQARVGHRTMRRILKMPIHAAIKQSSRIDHERSGR